MRATDGGTLLDNVTHTLVALTLARTPLGRAGRGTTAVLVIASNAPDIDAISAARGGVASYLQWHRGPTHGPLGVVGLGLFVAGVVWLAMRLRRAKEGDAPVATPSMLIAISMLGVLMHIGMDLPTSYGTRLLSPFDWRWFAADWLPIVDIYLLFALGAALVFGGVSASARRRSAAIALALLALSYGIRGVAHHEALSVAPRLFGPTLPQPCGPSGFQPSRVDFWPRPVAATSRDPAVRPCLVELAAIPTFLSPLRWRVIAHLSNAYEIQDIDLLDSKFRTPANAAEASWRRTLRIPNVWTDAVHKAATTRSAKIFLGFSRFPAARSATDRDGVAIVRWFDARFVGGIITLEQPSRNAGPFALTIRIHPDGLIEEELTR